jgi:predicted nucleic acid-binding protein
LVLSSYVIQETAAMLARPKLRAGRTYTPEEVARYCRDLLALAELVGELPEINAVPNDPKDNPVVSTAIAGKADYPVTGDRAHLLPLGEYQGVRMVSPRAFFELL